MVTLFHVNDPRVGVPGPNHHQKSRGRAEHSFAPSQSKAGVYILLNMPALQVLVMEINLKMERKKNSIKLTFY